MTILEELQYNTTRLIGYIGDNQVSTGTGFIFNDLNGRSFLVTARHVVEKVDYIIMSVLKATDDNKPILGKSVGFQIYNNAFCFHRDKNVDIAIANISWHANEASNHNDTPFFIGLGNDSLATDIEKETLIQPIENIIFIGYPNGLWDEKNYLPIARSGITASSYLNDYNGEKKFLIDASVFPGSSGSPVFIHYKGSYTDKTGNRTEKSLALFVGVVVATHVSRFQNIDLGIVFKAETVIETIDYFYEINKLK